MKTVADENMIMKNIARIMPVMRTPFFLLPNKVTQIKRRPISTANKPSVSPIGRAFRSISITRKPIATIPMKRSAIV